jgi:simple sugar transport system permease protein
MLNMETIVTGILTSAVTAGVVIIIAGIGEILAERTGVMNLGIEGMMSLGAVMAIIVVNGMGASAWTGILAAALAGLLIGSLFAVLAVKVKVNQLLAGLAITFIGNGLARHIGKSFASQPALDRFAAVKIPVLGDIPILGGILFNHNVLVYIAYFILPIVAYYILYKTRHGLEMRAVGQMPEAADASGVHVDRIRFFYTCVAGALAAIAGAYLTLALIYTWSDAVVSGRGWVAITLVFFSGWNPLYIVFGALLFGGTTSIGYILQIQGIGISPFFLSMTPYLVTILLMVVSWLVRRRTQTEKLGVGPAALAIPYHRE